MDASEAHRASCEARYVLAMPTRERRRAFLALVAQRRGKPAADALHGLVMKLWEAQKDETTR